MYVHLALLEHSLFGLLKPSLHSVRKLKLAHVERPHREAMCRQTAQLGSSRQEVSTIRCVSDDSFRRFQPLVVKLCLAFKCSHLRHETLWNRDKLTTLCHVHTAAQKTCQDNIVVVLCQYVLGWFVMPQ